MYLIFENKEDAENRNSQEAQKRGCNLIATRFWWWMIELDDGRIALSVGDGDGLTQDELDKCIEKLPEQEP